MLRTRYEIITRRVYQWQSSEERSRGRSSKRRMDCVEEDLGRASVAKFGKKSGRQRMTLCDIAEDREQWRELVAQASMAESSWTMKT